MLGLRIFKKNNQSDARCKRVQELLSSTLLSLVTLSQTKRRDKADERSLLSHRRDNPESHKYEHTLSKKLPLMRIDSHSTQKSPWMRLKYPLPCMLDFCHMKTVFEQ